MSEELYKVFRPAELDEMVGNESTIKSIKNAVESDSVPHLILISGPSGCGKTTIGRILKKVLDCNDHDYSEINCAVNGGVDYARTITTKLDYAPMMGSSKIYFMDECQKLTEAAKNAYLKPFEDTPSHVYFIMATSEPEALAGTKAGEAIITRSTHWRVKALEEEELLTLIEEVAEEEEIDLPKKVAAKIVEASNGSARLALVLLQQVIGLTADEMQDQIKFAIKKEAKLFELFSVLMWGGKSWTKVTSILKELKEDAEGIRRGLLGMAANKLVENNSKNWNRAYKIIDCLSPSTFTTGKAGLYAGLWEVIND